MDARAASGPGGRVRARGALLLMLSMPALMSQPGATALGAPPVGAPAPGFVLRTFDGGTLASKDLVGKVVVLNFWASWCTPCLAEMPLLERIWTVYQARDVKIVGINGAQDRSDDARAFLRRHKITYPNGRDETGRVAATYGVTAMPTTYFIGRDGRVQEQFVGGFAGDVGEEELRKRIEALLGRGLWKEPQQVHVLTPAGAGDRGVRHAVTCGRNDCGHRTRAVYVPAVDLGDLATERAWISSIPLQSRQM